MSPPVPWCIRNNAPMGGQPVGAGSTKVEAIRYTVAVEQRAELRTRSSDARIRSILRDRLYHFLPLYPHQGVHRGIQTTKRESFHDACSGLCLWNRGLDSIDRWSGIFQAELALVGVPHNFSRYHHALSRHHLFDRPPSTEAQSRSRRRITPSSSAGSRKSRSISRW